MSAGKLVLAFLASFLTFASAQAVLATDQTDKAAPLTAPATVTAPADAAAPAPAAVTAPADAAATSPAAPAAVSPTAREKFSDAAKKAGLKDTRIAEYLKALDARATQYGLKQDQIDAALDNLRAVLEDSGKNSPFDAGQRLVLVETALHNIALPTEIDQGYHPTCNITPVEGYVASKPPDKDPELIKQVALKGKYMTAEGKEVTPPKKAIMPGRDEKAYDLDKPNVDKRNHSSQVFQMTVVNGTYELGKVQRNGKTLTDVRYIMGPVRKQNIPNGWIDLGEDVLIDGNGNSIIENGEVKSDPGFTVQDNVEASKLVLGYKMPYIDGPSQEVHTYPDGRIETMPWKYDLPTTDRLLEAKKNGNLPMGVPTLGGAHVQTIHDVTVDKSGKTWVLIDNQHGAQGDGWVTLDDLHRAQKEHGFELKPTRKAADRPE